MHDILISSDGDLVPNWNGGLSEGDDDVIDYQDINWRVLTNDPEHRAWNLGANLEDLIGLPNNPTTASMGERQIVSALTFDGRFDYNYLSVKSVPISQNEIQFFIGYQKLNYVRTTVPYYTTVISVTG